MRARRQTPAPTDPRRGFSLLEVIVAVSLMTLLLAAVFSAMDLYTKITTNGMDEMKEDRITRAIVNSITSDLRSIVFRIEEESTDETEGAEGTATLEVEETIVDPNQSFFQDGIGLVGTPEELVLSISRPSRDLRYGLVDEFEEDTYEQPGDLKSVWYFLAITGANGLSGAVASESEPDEAVNSDIKGLARLEADQLQMDAAASATGDASVMAEDAKLLAPEINHLEFQYISNGEMFEEWDSTGNGGLPQAIEIVIGFRDPAESTVEGRERLSVGGSVSFRRAVIALPMADFLTVSEF